MVKTYQCRITLLRSNPQSIRLLQTADTTSFQTLHDMIGLLFRVNEKGDYQFFSQTAVIASGTEKKETRTCYPLSEKLCDLFPVEKEWIFSYRERPELFFRLELSEGEAADERKLPVLLRFRGGHLREGEYSAEQYNTRQRYQQNDWRYLYRERKETEVDMEALNSELYYRFCAKSEGDGYIRINPRYCITAKEAIDTRNLDALQTAAEHVGIVYTPRTKKKELADELQDRITSKVFLRKLFSSMLWPEFCVMEKAITEGVTFSDENRRCFLKLWRSSIYVIYQGGTVLCVKEAAEAFQEYCLNTPLWKERAVLLTILSGACELYWVLTEPVIRKIAEKCYPDLSADQILSCIPKLEGNYPKQIKRTGSGIFYMSEYIDASGAQFWTMQRRPDQYYLPEKEYLEELAEGDIGFSGTEKNLLYSALKQNGVSDFELDYYNHRCYELLLLESDDPERIADRLCNERYGKRNRNSTERKLLVSAIRVCKTAIRVPVLGGYTEMEAELQKYHSQKGQDSVKKMTVKSKVMPNELCPCGSGLKYKFCCGKRG